MCAVPSRGALLTSGFVDITASARWADVRAAALAAAANGFAATGGPKPAADAGAAPGASGVSGSARTEAPGASAFALPYAAFVSAVDDRLEDLGKTREASENMFSDSETLGGASPRRVPARGGDFAFGPPGARGVGNAPRGGVGRVAGVALACVCGFAVCVAGLGGAKDMRRAAASAAGGARGVAAAAGEAPGAGRCNEATSAVRRSGVGTVEGDLPGVRVADQSKRFLDTPAGFFAEFVSVAAASRFLPRCWPANGKDSGREEFGRQREVDAVVQRGERLREGHAPCANFRFEPPSGMPGMAMMKRSRSARALPDRCAPKCCWHPPSASCFSEQPISRF